MWTDVHIKYKAQFNDGINCTVKQSLTKATEEIELTSGNTPGKLSFPPHIRRSFVHSLHPRCLLGQKFPRESGQ